MITSTSYISLSKKYRPTKFTELLAQDVLTKILSDAIQHNRLAQSYLLAGIRGVGKPVQHVLLLKQLTVLLKWWNKIRVVPELSTIFK